MLSQTYEITESQDKAIKLIVEARGRGESESDMVGFALDDFILNYEDSDSAYRDLKARLEGHNTP